METMNISLPPALKEFVEAQVQAGTYGTVSEYIRQLIRDDQERRHRNAIDQKLLEALNEDSAPLTAQDWQDVRNEVRKRLGKRNSK